MTRNNADFQQHVRLYRGLNTGNYEGGRDEPNLGNLGVHWSSDLESAKRFSVGLHPDEDQFLGGDEETARGHVVEALVPKESVHPSAGADYNLGSSSEAEVPLLHNAPITIVGVHQTEFDPSTFGVKITHTAVTPWKTTT
jgi:hypothetical protein